MRRTSPPSRTRASPPSRTTPTDCSFSENASPSPPPSNSTISWLPTSRSPVTSATPSPIRSTLPVSKSGSTIGIGSLSDEQVAQVGEGVGRLRQPAGFEPVVHGSRDAGKPHGARIEHDAPDVVDGKHGTGVHRGRHLHVERDLPTGCLADALPART